MPFKFWKREKPEDAKGTPEKGKAAEKAAPKPKAAPEKKPEAAKEGPEAKPPEPAAKPEAAAKAEKPREAPAADLDAAAGELHTGLVGLGLTIAGTKPVFLKRIAAYPDGTGEFLSLFREKPYRAGTKVLTDWLGFHAPAEFEPEKLLADVNLRLSSFKLAVQMSDLTWLDQQLGLRKARLRLGDVEKVARFKDARDFMHGVNELIAPRKLAFLELETWSPEFAFLLVRDPKWEKLATTKLVVIKAPQTAVGGECGECGAPVGENWHDCLSCGAVFGTE
ncbi:MAG TPA: hypothetical protein VEY12_09420, partial [Thermoplasmata archaeon]|nr:hypothetical protein [Thermoplasmata archaeon]